MTLEEAWQKYNADCEEMRQEMLNQEIIGRYPALKANAHFILYQTQAIAYNLVMAPRQDSPVFYLNNYFEPLLYTAHQPCPDFPYRLAFVNGARKWRIWGKRNSAHWVDIQVANGWWGEKDYKGLGNYVLDDFAMDADGNFEIIACAEPQPGNWIELDAQSANNTLSVRPAMNDWDNEIPPTFYIEALDDTPGASIIFDEAEIIRRLDLAGEMVKHSIGRWTLRGSKALIAKVGINNFFSSYGDSRRGGANPLALYGQAVYEVADDQALIIEFPNPEAAYWSLSLGTWWWETINTTHHKSSINGHQAIPDQDGRFTVVLSLKDPGVANWLDPAGWSTGIIIARFYRTAGDVPIKTQVVPFSSLRDALPADTTVVTPAQRKEEIQRRQQAIMGWYHYR